MLNISVPINSVSFGFCSFHLLVELFKRGENINLFPIGNTDLSSYPAAKKIEGFENWLKESIFYAPERFKKSDKTFSLWHIINGSEQSYGVKRNLLTFHELSEITPVETNSLNNQDTIFVTNDYTKKVFENSVKSDVVKVPLGFDSLHFRRTNKKCYPDDRIVFSLFGKLEIMRKRHAKVIQAWIKKYGNNKKYVLHLHVFNPHLSAEQNTGLLNQIFGGAKPFNVNIINFVSDLNLFNDCLNAADIVLDMGTEGWSIPSFSAVAVGKHAVILNFAGLAEWATEENSVLISPDSMIEPYDNIFFHKGARNNQGLIADFNEEEFLYGCEVAENRFSSNSVNSAGLELQEKFTWEKTVDAILENLK